MQAVGANKEGANLPAFRMSHVRAARPFWRNMETGRRAQWARPSQFRFAKEEIWRISHETIAATTQNSFY